MVETRSRKKQRLIANTPALPPSVWMQIGDFLPRRDFNSLTYTCKAIHKFSQLPSVVPKWPEDVVITCTSSQYYDTSSCVIAFSPDGKTLVMTDLGARFHLWDVRRGKVPGFDDNVAYHPMVQFSPDGRFLAVICGPALRIFVKKEDCGGTRKGIDGFDPRHYQRIRPPEGLRCFETIVWAPDSKSFMGVGNDWPDVNYQNKRAKWDLVDGQFVQSRPLTVDALLGRLSETTEDNPSSLWVSLISFMKSPYFDAISGSRNLTMEEEVKMLEEMSNLCMGNAEDIKIVKIFRSQSQPSVIFVQTTEAKLYALESYRKDGSFIPSFRKLAESPSFPVKSEDLFYEPGMEVPGSNIISALYEDRNHNTGIKIFELQEKTLKGVTRDCNAASLVAMANQHVGESSSLTVFCFSPDGTTLVASCEGRNGDHCRIFSV